MFNFMYLLHIPLFVMLFEICFVEYMQIEVHFMIMFALSLFFLQ